MPDDFLGVGWAFPIEPRDLPNGGMSAAMSYYEQSIVESIWIILSTARGERVMRPSFGCGIHSLVFALDNPSTIGVIQHEVEEALLFWEPRINVLRVTVTSENRASAGAIPATPGEVAEPSAAAGGAKPGGRPRQGQFESLLLINIEYAVKADNSRFNAVYPFYLERGQP